MRDVCLVGADIPLLPARQRTALLCLALLPINHSEVKCSPFCSLLKSIPGEQQPVKAAWCPQCPSAPALQPLQSLVHMKEPSATAPSATLCPKIPPLVVVVHSRPCGCAEGLKLSLRMDGSLFCGQLWADRGAPVFLPWNTDMFCADKMHHVHLVISWNKNCPVPHSWSRCTAEHSKG